MGDKVLWSREKEMALEATVRRLTEQNGGLETVLDEKTARCSELSTTLQEQQVRSLSMQSEFEAYKKAHKISSDLGALENAVVSLQAKLEEQP